MAGATARAVRETRQARADARAVPESAGPAQAKEGVRAKKAGARVDRTGNYKKLLSGRINPVASQHFNNGDYNHE